ncbi:hypothetical protein [Streptomyces sp. NPDC046978]|uniref:hypothetical protein n=1 Tax=Streptomyces sp. NPDC046978 TaxID=3154704 RepID=UPI00340468E7
MADSQEYMVEALSSHLSSTYKGLALVCSRLPVPIELPLAGATNLEAVPALRRIMEIVEEVPMPEDHQAELFAACTFWLAAIDLFGLLVANKFHQARAQSVAACLIEADGILLELAEWLGKQKD